MARSKREVNVGEMLFKCNSFMQRSSDHQTGERRGHQSLMESILHATNNYKGFGYLNMTPNGEGGWSIPDVSRIHFYVHPNLAADYRAAEERAKELWGDAA